MPLDEERPPTPPDPEDVALGARIRRIREQRTDLTQQDVATRLGKHVNSVQRWESGLQKMRAVDVPPLASALGVSCDALLGAQRTDPVAMVVAQNETTYFVNDKALRSIREAKSIDALRTLFDFGIEFGNEVEPSSRRVTAAEYGDVAAEVRAIVAKLGGIPREWK